MSPARRKWDKSQPVDAGKRDPKTFKLLAGEEKPVEEVPKKASKKKRSSTFNIRKYNPDDGKPYPIEYLRTLDIKQTFLLEKERVFNNIPDFASYRLFASKLGKASIIFTRASKKGLLVKGLNEDGRERIDTNKTWDKMSEYYKMKRADQVKNNRNAIKCDPDIATGEHKGVGITVQMKTKKADLREITRSVHPDEMDALAKRWEQITGKDELPELDRRAVTRVLWNLRALQITNFLLDAMPYAAILMHMMNKWDLSYRESKRMISMVEKSMIRSLDKDMGSLVSKAYMRYERLFSKAMKSNRIRTATVINKEIINLFGIDIAAKRMLNDGGDEEDGHLALLKAIEAEGGVVEDEE